jgi:5-methylcytosine-specific restriction protein A
MRFKKLRDDFSVYQIDLINPSELDLDIESEILEEQEPKREGSVKDYYGKRYERDPNNRRRAIELHGINCVICGFDFEEKYGDRGRGYIEIHHTKPLSSFDEEQIVDPKTDLVPVCSNCHRMIHRRRNRVLSFEEMKRITKSHEKLRSGNHK